MANRPPMTFELLEANRIKLSDIFIGYVKKLYNRKEFKPEFDNCYIVKPSVADTGIAAIVKVSIIETILKPMTFVMYWKIHTSGFVEHFDGDPKRDFGPNAYARQMFMPYTQPVQEWIEELRKEAA